MQPGAQSKALEVMNSRDMELSAASIDDPGFAPFLDEALYNEFPAQATLIQKLAQALERVVQVAEFADDTAAIVDLCTQEWRDFLKVTSQLLSSEQEHAT